MSGMRWIGLLILGGAFLAVGPIGDPVYAQDATAEVDQLREEIRKLREKVEDIDRRTALEKLIGEEDGEPRQPVRARSKTRLDGGLTMIVQGSLNNEAVFGGDRTDLTLSADLIFESELRPEGFFILHGDFALGGGLSHLPPLLTGPNGTATGTNADVEGWPDGQDTFHINEAFYEQGWREGTFRIAAGHIDLTSYFDQNEFANSESFQFIAPLFVNNIAIDWGGNENFFGPGLVFHAHPIGLFEFSAGVFEGDGDYQDAFDDPFWIVEMELEPYEIKGWGGGLEGHYRFYLWSRATPHATILDPAVSKSKNLGWGISFDQELTRRIGAWVRFGTQDGDLAEFDRHVSGGLQFKGPGGRKADTLGLAFGASLISSDYSQASGLDEDEYYAEAYYRLALNRNLHLTPDIQYIRHPGGNGRVDDIYVYGLRAQVVF